MSEAARFRPTVRQGLLAATALLVLGGVVFRATAPDPETMAAAGGEAVRREVATARVRAVPIRPVAEVSGVLEARRSVELFSETRGPVLEVGAEELDRVEAGQVLVRVDPLLAEVAVERARAAATRTSSQLELARSNLERSQNLREKGVAAEADLDDAVNAERVAAAAVRESRAELVQARDELTKKTIAAPFAGVLRSFMVEAGEFLSDGQRIGELLDVETARATIGLADREVVAVRPGQRVDVAVEAYPNETFEGTVLRVGAASDPVNKKFPVEVELANADGRLLPGMVVTVSIDVGEQQPRTVVPRDATIDEFGLRFVYVIEGDNGQPVARRRRVAVRGVPFQPEVFEVVEGLAEGEEIALTGTRLLKDGEAVRRRSEPRVEEVAAP